MRKRTLISIILGFVSAAVTLAVKSPSLPFNDYLYHSPILTALFTFLNFPAFMVAVVLGVRSMAFTVSVVFVQWFVIGMFFSWLIDKIHDRRSIDPYID
jgi:hypothetical protein